MPRFTIKWLGSLGRRLPDAVPRRLLDVEISRRPNTTPDPSGRDAVVLEAIVDAHDAGVAMGEGRERIETAAAASAIVLNSPCLLEPEALEVHGDDGTTLTSSFSARAAIAANPLDITDLARLTPAANSWVKLASDPDERERIADALRWYDRSARDSAPIDMLLGTWIAFETVVKGGKRTGMKNPLLTAYAIPELRRILPAADALGIKHLLREIYDVERNEIVHRAKAELNDVARAQAARALARVVLEDALGVAVDTDGTAQAFISNAAARHTAHCTLNCP